MSPVPTPRTKAPNTGATDYGYSNARLRGMRSRLLRSEALERLMQTDDMHQLIQELLQTPYAPDLEEALLMGRTAAEVSEGLKTNLVRTYRKVFGFMNQEAKEISAVLLGRWDVFNIKTILRGKHIELAAGEISEGLLPVGALSQVDLDGLLMQNDIRGVIDTAVTWDLPQAPAMRDGYVEYQRTGELADLELALDRYYSTWAMRKLSSKRNRNYAMGRRILGIQVDIQNLVMVFRAARENLTPEQSEEYFLYGGNQVGLDMYQRLAALSDIDEILDGLRGTRFGKLLDEAAEHYLETMSVASFERALEDYFTRKVIAVGGTDPLGVGIPLAYLWGKQNEVTNVRIIVKSIAVGIPAQRTRRELILV
jgi:V/A-type H+/Na+-transporting ATPase subunit C